MLRNPFRDLDQKKLSRSSDTLKTQNDYYKIVNRRIFIFSIIVAIVFTTVFVRLVFVQVRGQEDYTTKLANYSSQEQKDATPRGQIYDCNGKVVVKTVAAHNIVYFPPKNVSTNDQWTLALKFSKHYGVESKSLTESDYKDLYLFLHKNEKGVKDSGMNLLSDAEKASMSNKTDVDKLIRSRITDEMINEVATDADKNAFVVYLAMNKLPAKKNKVVLEDVSNDDVAYLMEHKSEYPGFDVDFSSWKREYPYGDTLRDVLGSVSTSKQGVPAEERDYYEALGYSLVDRVGKSGLEKQYETLLSGTPKISEITYDEDGIAVMNEISSGKKGYDLHLSIDIELQQKVDKVLSDIVKKNAGSAGRQAFQQAFVVLTNPSTGEIYSMSGSLKNSDGKMINYSSGAYLDSYVVGSVVKGATVYMALNEGVQTRTSTEIDQPMYIAGAVKKSYTNFGSVNAVKALEVSSNVYMWKSVIKLAGGTYTLNQPLNVSTDQTTSTLDVMRQYYSLFGLGTKTGLDVPNEAKGVTGFTQLAGNLLDYAIGQYDSYTPIQLTQYVSTIANGGNKIEPKLVNSATEVNSNYTIFENKSKILSTLNGDKADIDTVRDGFRACVTGNHCGVALNTMNKGVSAKTGTAQVTLSGGPNAGAYTNTSEIGFAPFDDPKVAFVCSAPTSSADSASQEANICSTQIMGPVLEEFFKKY